MKSKLKLPLELNIGDSCDEVALTIEGKTKLNYFINSYCDINTETEEVNIYHHIDVWSDGKLLSDDVFRGSIKECFAYLRGVYDLSKLVKLI